MKIHSGWWYAGNGYYRKDMMDIRSVSWTATRYNSMPAYKMENRVIRKQTL